MRWLFSISYWTISANSQGQLPANIALRGKHAPKVLPQHRHEHVFETIVGAYNSRSKPNGDSRGLTAIADLLEPQATFCFPYPYCVRGQDAARELLGRLQDHTTDTYMVPSVPIVRDYLPDSRVTFNDLSGRLWAPSVSYSLDNKVNSNTCLVVNPEQWTWDLAISDLTKLSSLRVYFDEKSRLDQVNACGGRFSSSAAVQDYGLLIGASSKFFSSMAQDTIRNNLQVAFDGFVQGTMYAADSEEFASGWAASFTDSLDSPPELCDPYPSCFNSPQKIEDFVQFSADSYSRGVVRQIGTLMVAGNVAALQTIYSDIPKEGAKCIASHTQWFTLQLADSNTGPSGQWFMTPAFEKSMQEHSKVTIKRAIPGTKRLLSRADIFYSLEAYLHERSHCAASMYGNGN